MNIFINYYNFLNGTLHMITQNLNFNQGFFLEKLKKLRFFTIIKIQKPLIYKLFELRQKNNYRSHYYYMESNIWAFEENVR